MQVLVTEMRSMRRTAGRVLGHTFTMRQYIWTEMMELVK